MEITVNIPLELRKTLSPTGKALDRKQTRELIEELVNTRAKVYKNGDKVPVDAIKEFIRSKQSSWFLDWNVSSEDELNLAASYLATLLSDLNTFLVENY